MSKTQSYAEKISAQMKLTSAARNKALNIERDKMMKRKPQNSKFWFYARQRVQLTIAVRVARDRALGRKKGGSNSYTHADSLAY